jgi:arylsulfatase A
MGTHVPCVAYWKGHTPNSLVSGDLIDFTDFYTTFAEAAGVKRGVDDPIDGRSFLPQLMGKEGNPREWVLCHYQPYWGNFAGRQYVRNQEFKLYREGTFYHVPEDLEEARDLKAGEGGEPGAASRRMLSEVFAIAPPAPPVKGGAKAKERPVHPGWRNMLDPND